MSDETSSNAPEIDWPVFMTSGGFIVAFVGLAIVDIDLLSAIVNAGFSIATTYFGAYWQGLLLLTFVAAILVCVSPSGRATLGGIETPEMSTFKWVAIIMCTLLAGGGVFWAAAEPIAHFTNSPPLFAVASNTSIVVVSVIAPLVTNFWFTIVGGAGIYFKLVEPSFIPGPFAEHGIPAALLSMTQQLPFGPLILVLFLILTTIFVATTGDSMTYTVSMVMTGTDHPLAGLRVSRGIVMGMVAAILISIGSGGVSALQSFILVTAMPVSLILLPSLWYGPKTAWEMHLREMHIKETSL